MTHINTLLLHRLRLGELPAPEAERLAAHLAECALCAARAQTQLDTRRAFNIAPMPEALVPRPTLWERLRAWLPAAALVPAALAGTLVLTTAAPPPLVFPEPTTVPAAAVDGAPAPALPVSAPPGPAASTTPVAPTPSIVRVAPEAPVAAPIETATEADDGLRSKGVTPRLEAWVQTGESARPLYLGERLGAGSRVQLRYDPRGRRFVTFAGRDHDGVIEVYGTVAASEVGLSAAPFALTLDGSGGEQAFFALCTNQRPDPDEVMRAVRQNPVRMEGALVASVVVRKE